MSMGVKFLDSIARDLLRYPRHVFFLVVGYVRHTTLLFVCGSVFVVCVSNFMRLLLNYPVYGS